MVHAKEIAARIKFLKKELGQAELIAVTKYSPVEDVVMAYEAHQLDFGENRVADLKTKADYFRQHKLDQVRWHFIGHLQSNKVKELLRIPNLYAIHSVDSIRLLQELFKHQSQLKNELNLFFQVNTSREEEKSGFESREELEEAVELVLKSTSPFKLLGLMTMGTVRTENFEEEAKRCFLELKQIKEALQKKYSLTELKLSMGMSQDYKIALLHGADFVRIGSAIFK